MITLDVERAVEAALRHNPTTRIFQARSSEASASVARATRLENPDLRLRNLSLDSAVRSLPDLEVALRLPVPNPWTMAARRQRARLRHGRAAARIDVLKRQIRSRVRKLFARLAMQVGLVAQQQRTVRIWAQAEQMARRSVEQGAATALERSLASLRLASSRDELHAMGLGRQQIEEQLRTLVGIRPGQRIVFSPDSGRPLARRHVALNEAGLIRRALSHRQELRVLAARVGEAEADAFIARVRRWPWLRFVENSYDVQAEPRPLNFQFSLALEVPLLSLDSGTVAVRDARLARRRAEERPWC